MNIVERAKNILLTPQKEWDVIKGENTTVMDLFTKYAIILAAIPAIAGFIGFALIGVTIFGGTFRYPIGPALVWAALTYVLGLIGIYILALIVDTLAPSFGAKKDFISSLRAVVYSYTASWVAGIFLLIPSLSVISAIAGIYSLVLLYLGIKKLKDPPADKMVGYYVVTLIVALVVYFIIGYLVTRVAFGASLYGLGGLGRGF